MATKAFDMRIVEPSFEVKGMFILAKPRCFFETMLKTKPATKTKSDQKRKSFIQFRSYAIAKDFSPKKFFEKGQEH